MYVDGEEYFIRGVGFRPIPAGGNDNHNWSNDPHNYMDDLDTLREMGINTLRIYDGLTNLSSGQAFLDAVHDHGMKVIMGEFGWWWPYTEDITNPDVKERIITALNGTINRYKNHPAILSWEIGNERNKWTYSEQEEKD